jgi:hypothetical protein
MRVGVRRRKRMNAGGRPRNPGYVKKTDEERVAKITLPSIKICELSFSEWNNKLEEKINGRRSKRGYQRTS